MWLLLAQGDSADAFYIVEDGTVKITRVDPVSWEGERERERGREREREREGREGGGGGRENSKGEEILRTLQIISPSVVTV